MNLPKLKHKSLLDEKNLWQIYKVAGKIKHKKFNLLIGAISALVFGTYACLAREVTAMHSLLLKLAETGFSAAISLLGFLIAGFTLFGSLAKPELLLTMLHRTEEKSGLSYLKYNFYTLIRTFIYFLVFTTFQLMVIVFGQQGGFVSELVRLFHPFEHVVSPATRIAFVVSVLLWTFALLELKSFVFNVNHFVFTMIKFEATEHNDRLCRESKK